MPEALNIRKGTRYDSWTVEEELASDRRGNRVFLCRCTCGTKSAVLLMNLRRGSSTGCNNCCVSRGKKGRPKMSRLQKTAARVKRDKKDTDLEDAGIL